MKYLYSVLFTLLFTSSIYSQGYWKLIDSPTDKSLFKVLFIDSLTGWVGGDSTFIFKTTDGGLTWDEKYHNDEYDLKDIFFLDENIGWAVAVPIDFVLDLYALMLKTTDGGNTWEEEYFPEENIYFNSVVYLDTSRGWVGGARGAIYYTTNAGERWQQASIDSGLLSHLDILRMKFVNENFVVASGGHFDIAGLFWISRDGGFNWHSYPAAIDPIADFHCFDTLDIIGVSKEIEQYGSGTARTTDGGQNWVYTLFDSIGPASTIEFRTNTEAWVSLSTNALLLKSIDSGYKYTAYRSPNNSWILDINFTDSLSGYGVGEFGAIVKYVHDSATTVSDHYSVLNNYHLYQNYPNPFNPETNIDFDLLEGGFADLTVFNALGEKVATLVQRYLPAGVHSEKFSARDLPSGIYFYRLGINGYSEIRKMILLR